MKHVLLIILIGSTALAECALYNKKGVAAEGEVSVTFDCPVNTVLSSFTCNTDPGFGDKEGFLLSVQSARCDFTLYADYCDEEGNYIGDVEGAILTVPTPRLQAICCGEGIFKASKKKKKSRK